MTSDYRIRRAGDGFGGLGRGWIVVHQSTQVGTHRTTFKAALTWMDLDAGTRAGRAVRRAAARRIGQAA